MSFFDELKRRNVLRVAIVYLAASWLLIQVLETLFPIFRLDETSIQIVVIILGIGFIPALILSWVFERTPEGVKRDKDVDRTAPATIASGKGLDKIIIIVLVLALGYFAVDKFVLDPARDVEIVETATERARTEALYESYGEKSIVVLPFINMSADPEQDYFADGISEELLNLLARIQELRVISRTSAFSFKGKDVDIATIAESLDVDHVLEGSIRKSGDRLRITAQLIDARTDSHIWSETYDRTLDDIFDIQDEIAAAVVKGLRVELLGETPTTKKVNPQAYALMLKARNILDNTDEVDDRIEAESLLEQALELDPEYIDALSELVRVYYRGGGSNPVGREEALRLARELVDKIATIDPDDGNADGWLSWFALYEDFDIAASARYLERALKARATDVEFFRGAALYQFITLGQLDAAVAIAEFVVAHDPLCIVCQYHLARAYRFVGKFDEAEATIHSALILTGPGEYPIYRDLGRVLMFKGDPEAALQAFEKAEDLQGIAIAMHNLGRKEEFEAALARLHEDEDENPSNLATVYAWIGDVDKAFKYLDKEYSIDRASLSRIMRYPVFRSLYNDPRWQALLHKLGMSDAQLAAIDFKMPQAVLKTLENR